MKTAEEIADEVFDPRRDCFDRVDLVYLLREYGAQVREEAAKIAKQHDDEHHACTHQLRICGFIIAAAIRKMELP